jgi:DNA-binding MarR family transcriptional regulator
MTRDLPLSKVHLCVCANLRRTTRILTQFYDDVLRPSGLRATQFSTLAVIAAHARSPESMNQLASVLGMDRTTLTRNLLPLKQQGLIAISAGRDQRTRLVTLTPRGRAALERALPLWAQAQAQIAGGLGPERFRSVLGDLSVIESLSHAPEKGE